MKTLIVVFDCLATVMACKWCPEGTYAQYNYNNREPYIAEVKIKWAGSHGTFNDYALEYMEYLKAASMEIFLDSYVPKIVVIPKNCSMVLHKGMEYVFGFNDLFHLEKIYGYL
ncbi:hypothetical protein Y032_0008g51 [Ancylostoma ceylanicum]|uniref:Uncharacterized protein n=1 Tax=Ancylostoma ceylanicum TaxID=53326 RepID=A0A016VN80_9BILA|nr:hypothetical protein Y032_0008g51 [Ancylostoma ceylanicum]